MQYTHNTLGPNWCFWCPKCKAIFPDRFSKNYYHWPLLSKIDNFVEDHLTLHSWQNKFIFFKWSLAKYLIGQKAVGYLLNPVFEEEIDKRFITKYIGGECSFCGGYLTGKEIIKLDELP